MRRPRLVLTLLLPLLGCVPILTAAWPLDDADGTAIGRLEYMRRVESGALSGTRQPPGALLPSAAVDLRLLDQADFEIPAPDADFTAAVRGLLGTAADRYSIAVLDLSTVGRPVYAEHRASERVNPGSVGKLLVAMAWMQALADRFPDDLDARWALLRDTHIEADDVIIRDSHTVRRWDREEERLIRRPLEVGDPGSLFEFLDWMVSPSSNAAASVLIRQAMLFNHFGADYPLSSAEATAFFKETPRPTLEKLLARTLQDPVTRNGFALEDLRQGSLFTARGKQIVSGTTSRASARELMRFLVAIERGRVVDPFSSRIMKKLMYVTERRIRYASTPVLNDAAVYFKSGSLFRCEPEPDFVCKAYAGNALNLMHSVAIVEAPADERRLHYLVVVMSNVLRQNSAIVHQSLGTAIHHLIEARHRPMT
ncbi:MAG: serine hydrolase, partial [Gammaproteobacteria bacterium]